MKFEKGPGFDWLVTYDAGEGRQTMSIFGVPTMDEALREVHYSFSGSFEDNEKWRKAGVTILEIHRAHGLL